MHTIYDRLGKRISSIIPWQLILLTTAVVEILTAMMNTLLGYVWWGMFSADLVIIGTIDAFIVCLVVLPPVLFITTRLRITNIEVAHKAEYISELREHIFERKQAEDALIELRHQHELVLNSTSEGLIGLDRLGYHTFVNPAAARMLGYRVEELIGKNSHVIWHSSKAGNTGHYDAACPICLTLEDGVVHHQVTDEVFWRKDGTSFPVAYSSNPAIVDGGIVGAVVNFTDISKLKGAENELVQSTRKYRELVENLPLAVFEMDTRGDILFANRCALDWFGYTGDDLAAGIEVTSVVSPGEVKTALLNIQLVLNGDDLGGVEYTGVRKDGSSFPVMIFTSRIERGSRVAGVRGVIIDMAERKLAEREREITIEFLSLVNESTGTKEIVQAATTFFKEQSGCSAVGIRLQEGEDYPYFEARGFPSKFVHMENSLCQKDKAGSIIRDGIGHPVIECMCGNVILGRFDPSKPFFTKHGSFWTNCTSELLATTSDADRQTRTRNRCNGEGYESVALLPLRVGQKRFGLLQLNDRRKAMFTVETINLWERLADYLAVALAKFSAEEALRESESKYRSLFENMSSGFAYCEMIYDSDGRPSDFKYLDVNPAFLRLTGLEKVTGRRVTEVLHGIKESHPEVFEIYGRVSSTGLPEKFEVLCKPLNAWLAFSVYSAAKGYFVAIFDNISDRKHSEEKIKRDMEHLAALRIIDMAISGSHDLRITMNVLLEQTIKQLRVDAACVLLFNTHSQMLEYSLGYGFNTDRITLSRVRLGDGYAGRVALERQSLTMPEIALTRDWSTPWHLIEEEGFKAYIGVPLVAKGHVRGVLEIFNRTPLNPEKDWLNFAEALAGQAAIALDNAELFERLERSNNELLLAYDTTIEGWSRALDYRDRETEGHSQRVASMTLRVCKAAGMSDEELVHVRRGALLHDIGKLGVPDNILLKEGSLTDEEMAVIKRHPDIAYKLLSPIAFLHSALDIPYCHHEKWDGNGYPRGLKGEEIPLAARIFSIIDVWDALRSDRPYRAAWTLEETREYVISMKGSQFDPMLVDTFLSLEWHEH